MPTVEECVKLLSERGDSQYGGEAVTQIEHALQCAMLAENKNAAPTLIAAALLHDIGHLLHALPDDAPESGIDDAHEQLGYRYLSQLFPESVTEPVRMHVPAKRYLCATDKDYFGQLSEPSVVSLQVQGGPLSAEEVAAFAQNVFAEDAVRLRHWDDAAKIPNLQTPSLQHFVPYLKAAAR